MLELRPITESIGTEVSGIDVTEPISAHDLDRIFRAWIDTTILLFRNQRMTPAQHVSFTRQFGEVVAYTRPQFAGDLPEILVLSNITRNGTLIGSPVSGRVWHTDGHYLEKPPAGSMLYAIEVPPIGGDTWFANMFAAYAALPEVTKRMLVDLKVVISRVQSRPYNYPDRPPPTDEEKAAWIDMPQPIVRTHPVNGRKALYAGGNVPWRIEGMAEEESTALVTFVQEMAVRPQFTYCHKWRVGDIILWDNRSAMHRATAYDSVNHRRLMHRTTIAGDLPQYLPQ
jgi:alpha-ketoglutarate-dependent taurine dioxygenase